MLDPVTQTRGPDNSSPARRGSSPAGASEQPDLLLIERARGGSEQATEALLRRYGRRLFRVARTVIVDDERAESVVREACVAAFSDLSRYEPTGKFAAWLTRLTYQQARAERRAAWDPRGTTPGETAQPQDLRELAAAVAQLPEVFRTVFVLRVIEGISGIETAASLGVHETTVRTRLYRALRRLDGELVRSIRLRPDLLDLPAGTLQSLVNSVLAHLPRSPATAGGAAAP